MATRYRFSSLAQSDVKEIVEQIARQPGTGERSRRELRRTLVGCYLIFYERSHAGLIVVRVLHGARDYDRLLQRRFFNAATG